MAEIVEKSKAEILLISALKDKCNRNDKLSDDIKSILSNTHKTYKYILVTGLLAKATNNKVEPLALQAGAPLNGAYDARSLCHKVIVPFERDYLNNALGNSNEPFLNKPARFTHLSITNAVRKGRDKIILELLINIFKNITNSGEAYLYLTCALVYLQENSIAQESLLKKQIKKNPTLIEILEFIHLFLEHSHEGETPVLIVATLEKLFYSQNSEKYKVLPHKTNQSGSSSKEVGDIDIFKDNIFNYAIEVKDKDFTQHDLEHALIKMSSNNGEKGMFIYGPRANFDLEQINSKISEFEKEGFLVLLDDIYSYSLHMIFKLEVSNREEFITTIIETAKEINCKTETFNWLYELFSKLKWN